MLYSDKNQGREVYWYDLVSYFSQIVTEMKKQTPHYHFDLHICPHFSDLNKVDYFRIWYKLIINLKHRQKL